MLHFISSFLALITHVWKDECGIRGLVDSFCSNRELQAMERLEEACGTASDREIEGGLGYCRRPGVLQATESLEEAWGTASNRELGGGLATSNRELGGVLAASNREFGGVLVSNRELGGVLVYCK